MRTKTPMAACLALAGLSLLIPSAPTTDSWGWIVWGREILQLELSTVVPGAPSWKPLPVLFTTPLALAGDAAPALWLVVARAGALASLVMAYRVGDRLAGRFAGVLAAVGVALTDHWIRELAHGYSEPLAIALLLGAIDRHLAGSPRLAFLLAAPVALSRPEAWCLLVVYGLVLWRRGDLRLPLLAGVAAIVPALWVVPDWIGSGDPLHASAVSRLVVPTGTEAALTALGEAALIPPLPLSILAVAAVALALRRGDRVLLGIACVPVAWAALLAAMMLAGYPASSRFFVIPAALVSVLGAAGAVRVVEAARKRSFRPALAGLLAVAAAWPLAVRAEGTADAWQAAVSLARLETDLRAVSDRARPVLSGCGTPLLPNGLLWAKGAVAWELDVPLRRVRGAGTSVYGFVERLAKPGDDPLPRLAPGTTVTVRTRFRPFVLLIPSGDAPVRMAGRRGPPLKAVAAEGEWRVLRPSAARDTCGRVPGEPRAGTRDLPGARRGAPARRDPS